MKRIAVLTSGGDAPGMNAAIRSIVRSGIQTGYVLVGIRRGYTGLIEGEGSELRSRDVDNILHFGGTVLQTSRCEEFKTPEGMQQAKKFLEREGIDGLIVLGGDGSFKGALELSKIWNGQIITLPATIDNDLFGTDVTIGFDTAVNTALDATDKIRDTADAHGRFFLVEVMGRYSGHIALAVGLASGAEEVLIPEEKIPLAAVCKKLDSYRSSGKQSSIIIVAEGYHSGGAHAV
ncbi:MAG: 6-phosphofructokinase, partial [Chlamydiia bacterium]|nr:6-phosphofructokinase [Chlamydiia bacterium]